MPKVAKKPARKTPSGRKRTRRIAKRKVGRLEKLGQRLDASAGLLAAGAFQLGLLLVLAGALFLFLLSLFSGQMTSMPERLASAPESAARALGFNVMRVTIKGGEGLSTREIMAALRDDQHGSIIGRPMALVSAEDLRTRLSALGPVENVAVQKLVPDTIHLSVATRVGRALYQDPDGDFFLIDGEGIRIRRVEPTEFTELPTISGTGNPAEATEFVRILRRYPVLYARTAGIEVVAGRRFDLRFRNGFLAKLPETRVDEALDRLKLLDAGTGDLADNLNYLDLRDPDWAYFKPKEN